MSLNTSTIETGNRIGGKYVIERQLGAGGMGAVYLAENTDIGRKVAIKVLHADFASNPDLIRRFRQEARAAAAIGHPGIVDVLDMGTTEDGSAFIVMERLDGDTLGGRLEHSGRLAVKAACAVVADVLEALAVAHDKQIIHRDLKPDNIFLVERPVVITKILDFGISKLQGSEDVSLTRTGAVMGTPLYMSPEQARGAKDIGPATDLYSVGAILYHVLVGSPPFTGETYNEVLAKVLMEPHRPLGEIRPGLPAALTQVVDVLLDKEASKRPSAREAAARLRAIAASHDDRAALDSTMAAGPDTAVRPVAAGGATPVPELLGRGAGPITPVPGGGGAAMVVTPDAAVAAGTVPPEVAAATAAAQPATPRSKKGLVLAIGAVVVLAGVAVVALRGKPPAPSSAGANVAGADAQVAVVHVPVAALAPDAAPAVARVVVTLVATPAQATWTVDDAPVPGNPLRLERPRGDHAVAVARADGYRDVRIDLSFDEGRVENVALLPIERAPAPTRPHGGHGTGVTVQKLPPGGTEKPPAGDSGLTIDKNNPFKKP